MNKNIVIAAAGLLVVSTTAGIVAKHTNNFKFTAVADSTRTVRWNSWDSVVTSGGNTWELAYYGQGNGFTRGTTSVGTSVKNGSLIYPVKAGTDEPVLFRNIVQINVVYSADYDDTVEVLDIYNAISPVIGVGVDYVFRLNGNENLYTTATYTPDADDQEDRYVFFYCPKANTSIAWFEIKYSC